MLMNSNHTFICKDSNDYQKFKKEVSVAFVISNNVIKENFITDRFSISIPKITVTYFRTGKIIIQSSPDTPEIARLLTMANNYFSAKNVLSQSMSIVDISAVNKKYFIGLDESGAGETFGCLYLGVSIITKRDLIEAHRTIHPQDVKQLDVRTIIELNIKSGKFFEKHVERYIPREIDRQNKISLLDEGYIKLLLKYENLLPDSCVIIDDYGIGTSFRAFINKWNAKGAEFILSHKADSIYLPPMAASIIARKARNTEVNTLNSRYYVIDPETKERIEPSAGSPSNPMTKKWLIAYRKSNPYADFPFFVRKKWKNVQDIETKFPKKSASYTFGCDKCFNKFGKLCIRYDRIKKYTELICPICGRSVDILNFKKNFSGTGTIVMDTSSMITRMVSKDMQTSKIFAGMKFLVPSCVYEEIDTKEPDKKKGAENEIMFLKKCQSEGIIEFEDVDVDSFLDLPKDKKITEVVRQHNAALITYDRTQNLWSSIGSFVFYIID